MRVAWGAALVVTLALMADAAVSIREDASVAPTATVPVTLASSTGGTTTLGSSLTSASTTGAVLPGIGSVNVLKVNHGATAWTVRLLLNSKSGFAVTDSATVTLAGAATQTQVTIVAGATTQSTGTAVNLPTIGPDITIVAAGVVVGTGTLNLSIILTPSGGGPTLVYPYTLAIT